MRPGTVEPEYFDTVSAGEYLGIVKQIRGDTDPVRTLKNQCQRVYWLRYKGIIQGRKIGGRIVYTKAELDQAMRTGAHHACPPVNQSTTP